MENVNHYKILHMVQVNIIYEVKSWKIKLYVTGKKQKNISE